MQPCSIDFSASHPMFRATDQTFEDSVVPAHSNRFFQSGAIWTISEVIWLFLISAYQPKFSRLSKQPATKLLHLFKTRLSRTCWRGAMCLASLKRAREKRRPSCCRCSLCSNKAAHVRECHVHSSWNRRVSLPHRSRNISKSTARTTN